MQRLNSVEYKIKMMTPKITSLILLGMLMLVSVNTVPEATENPFCSADGVFELGVT